jgi:hypothetical protein
MFNFLKSLIADKDLRTLESLRSEVQGVADTPKRPALQRAADLWDVAHTAESEPGRIEYRFLGVTGEEEG